MSTSPFPIKYLATIICLFLLSLSGGVLLAQGRSIPKPTAIEEEQTSIEQLSDELPEGVKYRYPLLNGISVSANLFPPVMNLFGKDYGSYEGSLTIDLHHRFFPQFSAGVGYCDAVNEDSLRYKCGLFPFFKAGLLYNFKYNELKPNDFYGALLRFGYAYSKADISNMHYIDRFWGTSGPYEINDVDINSIWMEVGGFIKVEVANHFSLGWEITYKPFLHKGNFKQGSPFFVPGYGKAGNPIGFGFHIYYDLNRQ